MIQLPEEFDSIFRYIVVVSQRAEQLMKGAKARSESRHSKPTLIAQDDVDDGQVEWRILTQEELDARRQEIVEQFRAEVAGEGLEAEPAVRDVLPTAEAPDEDTQKDDELLRLQRLLGMAGLGGGAASDDDEPAEIDDGALESLDDDFEGDDDDDGDDGDDDGDDD